MWTRSRRSPRLPDARACGSSTHPMNGDAPPAWTLSRTRSCGGRSTGPFQGSDAMSRSPFRTAGPGSMPMSLGRGGRRPHGPRAGTVCRRHQPSAALSPRPRRRAPAGRLPAQRRRHMATVRLLAGRAPPPPCLRHLPVLRSSRRASVEDAFGKTSAFLDRRLSAGGRMPDRAHRDRGGIASRLLHHRERLASFGSTAHRRLDRPWNLHARPRVLRNPLRRARGTKLHRSIRLAGGARLERAHASRRGGAPGVRTAERGRIRAVLPDRRFAGHEGV